MLILGVGSPSGDDQAGWLVVDALAETGVGAELRKLDRPGATLVGLLDEAPWVILIDAMQSGAPVGDIRHFERDDWPAYAHGVSSHGFGVAEALALATALSGLPARLDLYGIEIGAVSPGAGPGAAILAAARALARRIAGGLGAPR